MFQSQQKPVSKDGQNTIKQKILRLFADEDGGKREISIAGFRHYLSASLVEVAIALDELERDKIIEKTNFGGILCTNRQRKTMIEPNFEDELKMHGMTPEQYKKFMDDWAANEYEQMLKNLPEDNYWDDCARQDGLIYPWE